MKIVEYKPEYGEVRYPEGFEETIRGLTIEEQMSHFCITSSYNAVHMDWRKRNDRMDMLRLEDRYPVCGLIVRDGLIAGVLVFDGMGYSITCMAEERVETGDFNDRSNRDFLGLVCMPPRTQ